MSTSPRSDHTRHRWAWTFLLVLVGALALSGPSAASTPSQTTGSGSPRVLSTTVKAPITPVIAGHLADGIARAERDGYDAYLVRLDTPGGLDTSMRDIVQHVFAAEVPVIVHIAPAGARGASAGAIITFASHVAAMAPGTSIGAATPVGGDGGDLDEKIVNDAIAYAEAIADARDRDREFIGDTVRDARSAGATEALELGVIDAVASSTTELLDAVDGTTVTVGPNDREVILRTADAVVDEQEMGVFRSIQQILADPNIAFLLLSVGTLGLVYELASPGIGVGAVLGLTFVTLGLFGLAVLSVNLVGVVFLLLAAALFLAEVFAPGLGLAAGGGAFALVLSGVFLFDDAPGLEISLAVVLPAAIVVALFVIIAGRFAMRARRAPSTTTGSGLFVGRTATVRTDRGRPQVFVGGAWWSVRPREPGTVLGDGADVEVVDVEGLTLVVTPAASPGTAPSPSSQPPVTRPEGAS
ncbi:MAG: NfeD family protein [Ilumatobacteraceae bacterium]